MTTYFRMKLKINLLKYKGLYVIHACRITSRVQNKNYLNSLNETWYADLGYQIAEWG